MTSSYNDKATIGEWIRLIACLTILLSLIAGGNLLLWWMFGWFGVGAWVASGILGWQYQTLKYLVHLKPEEFDVFFWEELAIGVVSGPLSFILLQPI